MCTYRVTYFLSNLFDTLYIQYGQDNHLDNIDNLDVWGPAPTPLDIFHTVHVQLLLIIFYFYHLKLSFSAVQEVRQLHIKQEGFVREISDLQETVEWKDKKIGVWWDHASVQCWNVFYIPLIYNARKSRACA